MLDRKKLKRIIVSKRYNNCYAIEVGWKLFGGLSKRMYKVYDHTKKWNYDPYPTNTYLSGTMLVKSAERYIRSVYFR